MKSLSLGEPGTGEGRNAVCRTLNLCPIWGPPCHRGNVRAPSAILAQQGTSTQILRRKWAPREWALTRKPAFRYRICPQASWWLPLTWSLKCRCPPWPSDSDAPVQLACRAGNFAPPLPSKLDNLARRRQKPNQWKRPPRLPARPNSTTAGWALECSRRATG
jgi:hypothetical protein